MDIARSLPVYIDALHMSDWKQDKKHRRGEPYLAQISAEIIMLGKSACSSLS